MLWRSIKKLYLHFDDSSGLPVLTRRYAFVAVLQGIALVLMVPFLTALFGPTYAMEPLVKPDWDGVLLYGSIIAAVSLFGFLYMIYAARTAQRVSVYGVVDNKTREVGESVISKPLGWFNASTAGNVSSVIGVDIEVPSHIPAIVLPNLLLNSITPAIVFVGVLFFDWRIPIALIIALPVASYLATWMNRSLMPKQKTVEIAAEELAKRTIEYVQLQPLLRATGTSTHGWQPLNDAIQEDTTAIIEQLKSKGKPGQLYQMLIHLGVAITMATAVYVTLHQSISIAVFAALSIMIIRFAEPMSMWLMYASELFAVESALERIEEITEAETLPQATKPAVFKDYSIRLNNVTFGYTPETMVLDGLQADFAETAITALVGPSGSGKSTITKLIARFWDVNQGNISIGGVNVKNIPQSQLMDSIAMVFQNVYLFDTTIKENVIMGNPQCTQADLDRVAELSGLTEVIERLENGWDTEVGAAGELLSGGEKQRVSIARALLKDSPILLLDEITSALDGNNEAIITQATKELCKGRTVVVVAHRLSTIKDAHQICFLRDGHIVERGTHDELLASGGEYARYWNIQQRTEEWHL